MTPRPPPTELERFNYEDEKFGYSARLASWTQEQNRFFVQTTKQGRSRAGFKPVILSNEHRLQCQFCNVSIYEPMNDLG